MITKNLSRAYAPADTDKHVYAFLASDEFPRVVETLAQAGLGVYTGTIGLNGQCSYPLFRFDKQALDDFIKNNKTIEL